MFIQRLFIAGLFGGLFGILSIGLMLPAATLADCTDDTNTNTNTGTTLPVVYSTAVKITELLPNPSGTESTDEFIELYNDSNETIDLTNWELSDATTNSYTLEQSIGPDQYIVVYREATQLALNNSGDSAELYNPSGELVDSVTYTESAADDTSYALTIDGDWSWTTTLTPGRTNSIADDAEEVPENTEENADDTETTNDNTNTNSDNSDATLPPSYDYSDAITLSELLPDPDGSDATDEWIELYNNGDVDVDLYGWQVTDGSHIYTFPENSPISADTYLVLSVEDSSVSLNNSGETITLSDPSAEVMSSVTYSTAPTGESDAMIDGDWQWTTTLTPGDRNISTAPINNSIPPTNTSGTNTNTNTNTNTTTATTMQSIAAIKQLTKGDSVEAYGVVNVLPDTFGSQYFYIEDDTSGIEIYSSQKYFPELAIGDYVQITGTLSEANGEIKINTSTLADIVVLEHDHTLVPAEVTEYVVDDLGTLIIVSGEVTNKSGSTITFDSGWNVYLKQNTDISTTTFTVGEHYAVVGVLTGSDDGIRVQPRTSADVSTLTVASANGANLASYTDHLIAPAQASDNSTMDANYTVTPTQAAANTTLGSWLIVVSSLGAASVLLWKYRGKWWQQWQRKLAGRVHDLVIRLDHYTAPEKNTTDLNVPNQYHE